MEGAVQGVLAVKGTYAFSLDRETFSGVFSTRDEAFQAGVTAADRLNAQVTEIYVGQRVAGDAQANLHSWEIIKCMRDRARQIAGDDANDFLAHVTEQQANDLDGAIEAVVTRWLNNYKLAPTFFRIEAISEHPMPTVTHATFGQQDDEVTDLGESEWR
jgi:hypothetical protein